MTTFEGKAKVQIVRDQDDSTHRLNFCEVLRLDMPLTPQILMLFPLWLECSLMARVFLVVATISAGVAGNQHSQRPSLP